jgi:DNA-binding transcriptional ArsR family regulator
MTNALATEALSSLADPTRRQLFERLAEGPRSVGELATTLPVSRPAVSQHLRVLKEAQLVTDTAEGTRRIYRIDPRGIGAIRGWLDSMWSSQLASFAAFAEAEAKKEQGK